MSVRCSYLPTWRRWVAWRSTFRDRWSSTRSAGFVTSALIGAAPGHVTRRTCRFRSATDFAPVPENDSPSRVSTSPLSRFVQLFFTIAIPCTLRKLSAAVLRNHAEDFEVFFLAIMQKLQYTKDSSTRWIVHIRSGEKATS